jgi:hypothetical protein
MNLNDIRYFSRSLLLINNINILIKARKLIIAKKRDIDRLEIISIVGITVIKIAANNGEKIIR